MILTAIGTGYVEETPIDIQQLADINAQQDTESNDVKSNNARLWVQDNVLLLINLSKNYEADFQSIK